MNILFVSGIYPPDIGGPATYISRMASELKQLGHAVQVLTLGARSEKLFGLFPVRKVMRGKSILLRGLRMFVAAMPMAKKADIIYATGSLWDSWIISLITAKVLRKKLILKIVGDSVWEWAQRMKFSDLFMEDFNKKIGKARLEILKWLRNYLARMADLIIIPSAFLRDVVTQWGVQTKQLRVIYNAMENPFQGTVPHKDRNREIITVARLVSWKGVDGLIRIVNLLPKDIKLVIIGDGPLLASLKEQAKNELLEERVEFTGRLLKDQVFKRLRRSTIFVLNSRYEGFPHTVLEAMAAGAVVVATDVGGNSELIKDRKNGFLVPAGDEKAMADKIILLLQDEILRQRLTEEALRRLSRFSWDNIVSETEEQFREILEKK